MNIKFFFLYAGNIICDNQNYENNPYNNYQQQNNYGKAPNSYNQRNYESNTQTQFNQPYSSNNQTQPQNYRQNYGAGAGVGVNQLQNNVSQPQNPNENYQNYPNNSQYQNPSNNPTYTRNPTNNSYTTYNPNQTYEAPIKQNYNQTVPVQSQPSVNNTINEKLLLEEKSKILEVMLKMKDELKNMEETVKKTLSENLKLTDKNKELHEKITNLEKAFKEGTKTSEAHENELKKKNNLIEKLELEYKNVKNEFNKLVSNLKKEKMDTNNSIITNIYSVLYNSLFGNISNSKLKNVLSIGTILLANNLLFLLFAIQIIPTFISLIVISGLYAFIAIDYING